MFAKIVNAAFDGLLEGIGFGLGFWGVLAILSVLHGL